MKYAEGVRRGEVGLPYALGVLDELFDGAKDIAAQTRVVGVRLRAKALGEQCLETGMLDYLWPKVWPLLLAEAMDDRARMAEAKLEAQRARARCRWEAKRRNGKRRTLLARRAELLGSVL